MGGYKPNLQKLKQKGYLISEFPQGILTETSANHGRGVVKGTIKRLEVVDSGTPVCIFNKASRTLIWETKSRADGSYLFKNLNKNIDCFVIAFDPNNQYNAVIQDRVVPK